MGSSLSSIPAGVRQPRAKQVVGNVDARIFDQSQGHTYNIYSGGNLEINNGAEITGNNFNPSGKVQVPPPHCPAPCTGYIRRNRLEEHMSSYIFGPSHDGQRRKRFVLHGLGGSGKTQGALTFLDDHFYSLDPGQRRFSEAYWVDATSTKTITKCLADIACSAGVGSKAEDALLLLASHNAQSNWIMLYNNADDPSLDLTPYFPKCTHGTIIITTRNRQAIRYGLGPGSDYGVSGMEPDEAGELLMSQARLFNPSPEVVQVVTQLVKELNYFPLSVRQAGSYISAALCTPDEYLDKLRSCQKQLLRKHNKSRVEDYQYGSVEATLSLSFDKLSSVGQQLLRLCACFHHEYILERIFSDGILNLDKYESDYKVLSTKEERRAIASLTRFGKKLVANGRWDADKFRRLLQELQSYSLIIFIPEQHAFSIHPLVQKWARSIVIAVLKTPFHRKAAILLGSNFRVHEINWTDHLASLRALAPHVDEVVKAEKTVFSGCQNQFGWIYRSVGRFSDEIGLREKYRETCKRVLGQRDAMAIQSMRSLAFAYSDAGNYMKAGEIFLDVLEIHKVWLGVNHLDTHISTHNLALAYKYQGNYAKAAEMLSELVEIWKLRLGIDHLGTLTSISNLATVHQDQGNYAKAAEMFSEVLEIRKVRLGIDHPDTLTSINNLAMVHTDQGNYPKAAEMFSEVLEIWKVQLGVDHPDTLSSINNLALVHKNQGNYPKAGEMLLEVLEIGKVRLGADHPNILTSINNLAIVYHVTLLCGVGVETR